MILALLAWITISLKIVGCSMGLCAIQSHPFT